jgi:hypothetical protein
VSQGDAARIGDPGIAVAAVEEGTTEIEDPPSAASSGKAQ